MAFTNWQNIWFNPWLKLWFRPMFPLNDEDEGKEEVQTKMFPWFSDRQVEKLREQTKDIPVQDRLQKQQEIYQEVLPKLQDIKIRDSRIKANNNLYHNALQQDWADRTKSLAQYRLNTFATQLKDKYNIPQNVSDNEILQKLFTANPNKKQDFTDYLNWKNENILFDLWLKEKPVEELISSQISNWIREYDWPWSFATRWFANLVDFVGWWLEKTIKWWGGVLEKWAEKLAEWLKDTALAKWIYDGAIKVFGEEEVRAYQALSPQQKRTFNTTLSQDILNLWEWAIQNAMTIWAPLMSAAFSMWAELPVTKGVLQALWEGTQYVWSIINEIPWLSDFKESLPEEDQIRFDDFIGNVWIGLLIWAKGKKNIIKDPKQFIKDNINPAQVAQNFQENVLWLPSRVKGTTVSTAKWISRASQQVIDKSIEQIQWLSKAKKKALSDSPYAKQYIGEAIQKVDEWNIPADIKDLQLDPLRKLTEELDIAIDKYKKQKWEESKAYKAVRSDETLIDTTYLIDKIDKALRWSKLNARSLFRKIDPTNWLWINDIMKWEWTIAQLHDVRKSLDKIIYSPATSPQQLWLVELTKKARKLVDDELSKNPKFKELDSQWRETTELLNEIQEWVTYREARKRWQLKDNIDNILLNLTQPAKAQLLERLDKFVPWIWERASAIKMIPEVIKAYTTIPNNRVVWALWWWLAWWTIWWLPWLLIWSVAWFFGDIWLSSVRQRSIKNAVMNMSDEAQSTLENIQRRIEKWEKLNRIQLQKRKQLLKQIKQNIPQSDKKLINAIDNISSNLDNNLDKSPIKDVGNDLNSNRGVDDTSNDKTVNALEKKSSDNTNTTIEVSDFDELENMMREASENISEDTLDTPTITDSDITDNLIKTIYDTMDNKWDAELSELFNKIDDRIDELPEETRIAYESLRDDIYKNIENEYYQEIYQDIKKNDEHYDFLENIKNDIRKLDAQERRIGRVWRNKVNKSYSQKQSLDRMNKKEKIISNIQWTLNIDQFEALHLFDRLANEYGVNW